MLKNLGTGALEFLNFGALGGPYFLHMTPVWPTRALVGSGAGDKTNMQAAKNELMRRVTRIGDLVY